MKKTGCIFTKLIACGAALLAASLLVDLQAQTVKEGKAVVRSVRGSAKYSTGDGVWVPVRVGTTLKRGAVVQTAADSTVDLFLGVNGPVVRVSPDTTMGFDRLSYQDTGIDSRIETQLDLRSGRILGNVKKLAAASKYEVKTPNGVAGIRGTDYDISVVSLGAGQYKITITSITGTIVAAVEHQGNVVTAIVNTGETWSPGDPAPRPLDPELLRVLQNEIRELLRNAGIDDAIITVVVAPPEFQPFISPGIGESGGDSEDDFFNF